MGRIGRIWHRMYPVVRVLQRKDDPQQLITRPTSQFFEFLTFFPSDSPDGKEREFQQFLDSEQTSFEKLWG